MEGWFFEKKLPGAKQDYKIGFKIKRKIFSGKSKYQKIEIFDTHSLGRILVLDGIIQLSQKYEFIYHEMISHLALFYHQNPKKILIVGGGDGGVLREVLKHPIKEVYLVEIDKKVLEISKKYLPFLRLKKSLKQKKVKIFFEDGSTFVKKFKDFFDVMIVDSTDPFKTALPLFQKKFYYQSSLALKKNGIFITQSGNFLDQIPEIKNCLKSLKNFFPFLKVHFAFIPDYQRSDFSFVLASKKINFEKFDFRKIKRRFKKIKGLRYYSPEIHFSSGILPAFYQKKLKI